MGKTERSSAVWFAAPVFVLSLIAANASQGFDVVIPDDAVALPKEPRVFQGVAMFDALDGTYSCSASSFLFVPDQGSTTDYFLRESIGPQVNTFRLVDSNTCSVLLEENNFILPPDIRCFDDIFGLQDTVRNPIYDVEAIAQGKRYIAIGGGNTQTRPSEFDACNDAEILQQQIVDDILPFIDIFSTQSNFTVTTPESTYQVGQTDLATVRYLLPDDEQGQFQLVLNMPQISLEGDGALEFDFPMGASFMLGGEVREASQSIAFEATEEGEANLSAMATLINLGTSESMDLTALATVNVITPVDTIVNSVDDTAREVGAAGCDTGNTVMVDGEEVPECTLRAAIETVNIDGSGNIRFSIPILPASSIPRIVLASELPEISVPVIIDGTSQQAGRVELFGGLADINGFTLAGGDSTVRGMVFNGFISQAEEVTGNSGNSIVILTSGNNQISGNYFGTDSSGTIASPTSWGITIRSDAGGNIIGGPADSDRNIFVAEQFGVMLFSNDNRVENNYFGTDVTGSAALGGTSLGSGILIAGSNNTIGGPNGAQANIIRGIRALAIVDFSQELPEFFANPSNDNVVQGNLINLLGNGDSPVENAFAGLTITGGSGNLIENNRVAGHSDLPLIEVSPTAEVITDDDAEVAGRITNTRIIGNEVGLIESGTRATNAETCISIDGDSAEEGSLQRIANTTIENNKVAGCTVGVDISGSVTGTVIRSNTVGVQFDNAALLPVNGMTPIAGVLVDPESDVEVDSNTIIGSVFNLELASSSPPDDSGNSAETEIRIINNHIGANPSGTVPAATIQQVGINLGNLGALSNILVDNNDVSSHGINSVSVPGGAENFGFGVNVVNSKVRMRRNTIAGNNQGGITIAGEQPVLIEGGSIFENNDIGIVYQTPPHNPVPVFPFKSDPDPNGDIFLLFLDRFGGEGAPTEDVSGMLEIYGNDDCTNPEGRVPVLTQSINRSTLSDRPWIAVVRVPMRSSIASLQGFTATLTIDESTSEFSSCAMAMELEDTDGDGAFDIVEELFGGDKNDDGIDDREQNTVATAVVNFEELIEGDVPETGEPILAVLEATEALQNVVWRDTSETDLRPTEGQSTVASLPFGLVGFEIVLPPGSEGGTAQVAVGLTPAQNNQDYIKITNPAFPNEYTVMPTSGDGDRAERLGEAGWLLTLTDGGEFDADGLANGLISDPGGPAVINSTTGGGGGGGAAQLGVIMLLCLLALNHRMRKLY